MFVLSVNLIFFILAIYILIVFIFMWIAARRTKQQLVLKDHEIETKSYETAIFKELGERIGYSLNVQKIADIITGSLGKFLQYSAVSYLIKNDSGRMIFHSILDESVSRKFIEEVRDQMISSYNVLTTNQIKPIEVDESLSGTITDEINHKKVESFFNVPVVIEGVVVGVLNVSSSKPAFYKEEEMDALYEITNQACDEVSKLEDIINDERGRLSSMLESMMDGVLMVNDHNQLLVINPAALHLLHISKSKPTIFDVLDQLSRQLDLRTKIEESIKLDKIKVIEHVQLFDSILRIMISPVRNGMGQVFGAVVLLHDVTRESQLEKMREDFTSMMIHELRSPLTGIRSIANLLKEENIKKEQKKYQDFVDLIVSNSATMLDLVNDLLDVAKLESGRLQIVRKSTDIEQLISTRKHSFESLAAENHLTLQTKVEEGIPHLQLDEIKVTQILNNFLSNAIKFTPEGKIIISAFILKKNQSMLEKVSMLGMSWPGMKETKYPFDNLILAVTDSGVGISDEQMSKLFNKFTQLEQTATSQKKGTGLGLVISKGIVEAHGGRIGVFSDVDNGSTFFCSLPLVTEAVT
jgi:signal transduction histidine kinase